jgi:VanZ family protein
MSRIGLLASLVIITHLATTQLTYPYISDIYDKLQHILAFFTLGWLADHAFPGPGRQRRWFILLLGYGLALELIQAVIPGRYFSLLDLGADACGLALYLIYRLACTPSTAGRRKKRSIRRADDRA